MGLGMAVLAWEKISTYDACELEAHVQLSINTLAMYERRAAAIDTARLFP